MGVTRGQDRSAAPIESALEQLVAHPRITNGWELSQVLHHAQLCSVRVLQHLALRLGSEFAHAALFEASRDLESGSEGLEADLHALGEIVRDQGQLLADRATVQGQYLAISERAPERFVRPRLQCSTSELRRENWSLRIWQRLLP